jgi:hypothetical protein
MTVVMPVAVSVVMIVIKAMFMLMIATCVFMLM